jgi:hypothetical protein
LQTLVSNGTSAGAIALDGQLDDMETLLTGVNTKLADLWTSIDNSDNAASVRGRLDSIKNHANNISVDTEDIRIAVEYVAEVIEATLDPSEWVGASKLALNVAAGTRSNAGLTVTDTTLGADDAWLDLRTIPGVTLYAIVPCEIQWSVLIDRALTEREYCIAIASYNPGVGVTVEEILSVIAVPSDGEDIVHHYSGVCKYRHVQGSSILVVFDIDAGVTTQNVSLGAHTRVIGREEV